MNEDVVCYFVLPKERTDAMLRVGVISSLVFMAQGHGLIKVYLYIESKVIKLNQ